MDTDQFVGNWKLVSFEFQHPDGRKTAPYGDKATGMISYDATGHMWVQIMRADRPLFASGDRYNGTQAEIRPAFEGYLGYWGRYTVDNTAHTVTHHITGCSFPNWVGQDQKRFFEFSGSRLILSTPLFLAGGDRVTGMIVWGRT